MYPTRPINPENHPEVQLYSKEGQIVAAIKPMYTTYAPVIIIYRGAAYLLTDKKYTAVDSYEHVVDSW